jgi:glutamyl-tRNA synthetase
MVEFLFVDEPAIDPASWDKAMKHDWAPKLLDEVVATFSHVAWNHEVLHAEWKRIADELVVKPRLADGPVRVAVTGRTVGPPLFESLELLGRDETLRRLGAARERVGR